MPAIGNDTSARSRERTSSECSDQNECSRIAAAEPPAPLRSEAVSAAPPRCKVNRNTAHAVRRGAARCFLRAPVGRRSSVHVPHALRATHALPTVRATLQADTANKQTNRATEQQSRRSPKVCVTADGLPCTVPRPPARDWRSKSRGRNDAAAALKARTGPRRTDPVSRLGELRVQCAELRGCVERLERVGVERVPQLGVRRPRSEQLRLERARRRRCGLRRPQCVRARGRRPAGTRGWCAGTGGAMRSSAWRTLARVRHCDYTQALTCTRSAAMASSFAVHCFNNEHSTVI